MHRVALATWFGVRPLLACAAAIAAAVHGGLVATAEIAVLLMVVRPLRRGWIGLLPVAAAAPFAPAAAILLAARLAAGELALQLAGGRSAERAGVRGRRRRGVAAVCESRRALLRRIDVEAAPSLAKAASAYERARRPPVKGAELETAAFALLGTTWGEAHPLELVRRVPEVFVTLLSTVYDDDEQDEIGTGFGVLLAKGYIIETVGPALAAVIVLVPATVGGALLFPVDAIAIGPVEVGGSVAQGLAILVLGAGVCARSVTLLVVGGIVAWLLTGSQVWNAVMIAGVAGVAGAAGLLGARAASQFAIAGRRARPRAERVKGPRRLRAQWKAADSAADNGRVPIAIDLLQDLADSAKCPTELRARADSRRARLLFEVGHLEDASAALGRVPADASDDPEHLLALGTVATGVGDLQGAERHLTAALERLAPRSPLAHPATMRLAQVLSRLDRPDDAIALMAVRGGAWSYGGFVQVVEGETAIAGALRRRGDADRAAHRLDEAIEFGSLDPVHAGELSKEMRRALARAEAGARLMAGETALERGRYREAAEYLRGVQGRIRDGVDAHLLASSQALHGAALILSGDLDEGLCTARRGVEALEARRRQLRRADRRTGLIVAEGALYDWCLTAFAHAADKSLAGAAETAAWLIESLRKSAISSMLRDDALKLPAAASALADRISGLEQRVNVRAADGTMRSGELDGAAVDEELSRLRGELGSALSEQFARSYIPSATSVEELRAIARRHGDVLSFYLPGGVLPGWRAWISSSGEFSITRLELDDSLAREVLDGIRMGEGERFMSAMYEPLRAGPAAVWETLCRALLPEALRAAAARAGEGGRPGTLIIVPDGFLGLLPWAALQVQGTPLGGRYAIQLVPSLGLVDAAIEEPAEATQPVALAYFDERLPGHLDEYATLARHLGVIRAHSRREFVNELGHGRAGGVYVAAHGQGLGLDQGISFDDGFLSAGSALLSRWPDWTIFASCLVGRVQMTAGQEPLGLPISCVLGGSRSVLAAMVEIPSEGVPDLVAPLLAELARGSDPAYALVSAQRQYLDDHPHASVAECLAFVCVSRAPRPTRTEVAVDLLARTGSEIAAEAAEIARTDLARATELFRRALEVHPDPGLVLRYAGFLAASADTRAEARPILERAIEDAPEDLDAWSWYAWFLDTHTEETEPTRAAFERTLELDPDHRWAIARFARFMLARTEEYERAATLYARAVRDAPRSAGLAVEYGDALERLGDLARAGEMYERALTLDPNRRGAGGRLARVIARTGGEPERVANLLERAITLDAGATGCQVVSPPGESPIG